MPCILSTTFARPAAATAGENLLIRKFTCVCSAEKVRGGGRGKEREMQTGIRRERDMKRMDVARKMSEKGKKNDERADRWTLPYKRRPKYLQQSLSHKVLSGQPNY